MYPATGIEDPQFPREQNIRLRQLPGNMIKQTIYPFLQLFEQLQASRPVHFFRARFFSAEMVILNPNRISLSGLNFFQIPSQSHESAAN
ncbi:MAG: hypothetical protein WDO71_24410 [Bacteroidota bacterium]